jgi:hypothetical protein
VASILAKCGVKVFSKLNKFYFDSTVQLLSQKRSEGFSKENFHFWSILEKCISLKDFNKILESFDWNKSCNFQIKCDLETTQPIKRTSQNEMQILAPVLASQKIFKIE